MTLLDLQKMDVPETTGGGGGESSVSLLLCDKHSGASQLLCL
ncbi:MULTISPECIES: SapB/AmfS family lanthipeptide [unclassified Streptomyces]